MLTSGSLSDLGKKKTPQTISALIIPWFSSIATSIGSGSLVDEDLGGGKSIDIFGYNCGVFFNL